MNSTKRPAKSRRRLGELLVDGGLIDEAQLNEALAAQKQAGTRLGTQLLIAGCITEAELAGFLSEQLGLPSFSRLSDVDPAAVRRMPAELALRYCMLPIGFTAAAVRVAMADPSDPHAIAAAQQAVRGPIEVVVAPELVLSYGVRRFYAPDFHYEPDPREVRPQFSRDATFDETALAE